MLRYFAIVGLVACSVAFGAEPKLQIRAEGSVTVDGDVAQVQGKFTTKPGGKLSLSVQNEVETRFEFIVKLTDSKDVAIYTIDVVITRDGKVISRPTVQTLAGHDAKFMVSDSGKNSSAFSITIEPVK